jgi:hypothetical protein
MSDDRPIRITRDEALSQRVDELLQRQHNLRGERGSLTERRVPWYLRNWVVLSLAGLAGALLAWALVEPRFDDVPYVQGPAESVEAAPLDRELAGEAHRFQGQLTLNGTVILVPADAARLEADGTRAAFDLAGLAPGTEVGVYAEYVDAQPTGVGVARAVVTAPPPATAKSAMKLESLARRSGAASLVLFPLVAGLVGLAIGAADGLVCRLPRRALLAGVVGLLVGLVGGLFSSLMAAVIYTPLSTLASRQMSGGSLSALGFFVQVIGRTLAWAMAGAAMGLGQGVALRSSRLLLFGFLGGVVGGLLGGLFFDPIDLILFSGEKMSAHWSRLIGFGLVGASVGAMIGVVELLARDAWLRMTEGPLAGKEFLIFRDVMTIGSSPRSDVYLFNDPLVAGHHATLRMMGDECEIEGHDKRQPVLLNGRPVTRTRLGHGDQMAIGHAVFVFQRRQS